MHWDGANGEDNSRLSLASLSSPSYLRNASDQDGILPSRVAFTPKYALRRKSLVEFSLDGSLIVFGCYRSMAHMITPLCSR